jgi:hypothetical protein
MLNIFINCYSQNNIIFQENFISIRKNSKQLHFHVEKFATEKIHPYKFDFLILDSNFKKLTMRGLILGQPCFDCKIHIKIVPKKLSLKEYKRFIEIFVPLVYRSADRYSSVRKRYLFDNETYYITLSYKGEDRIYYSDTIPLYVW